jgi:predicted ester cyclase
VKTIPQAPGSSGTSNTRHEGRSPNRIVKEEIMSNADTLRRIFALMDEKKFDAIIDLLGPSFMAQMGGNPPMNVEQWKGMGHVFFEAFPDGKHTIDECYDIPGERVGMRGSFEGTHKASFMGIPPTGKKIRMTFMSLERFQNGKLVEHRFEGDMAGLLTQLGVLQGSK